MSEGKTIGDVIGAMAIKRRRPQPAEPYRRPDLFDASEVDVWRDDAGRPGWSPKQDETGPLTRAVGGRARVGSTDAKAHR